MVVRRVSFCVAVLGLTIGAVAPVVAQQQSGGPQNAEQSDGFEGFGLLISPGILNKLIDRAVERMAHEYGFDEAQTAEVQRVLKERVPKFFRENQKEATRLMNDFLDAQLENDAPSPENVAGWAQRALPLVTKGREFLGVVTDDMRNYMTEDQQARMDATLAAVDVGGNMLEKRLNVWADGGFDATKEWHRNPGVREIDRQRARELEKAMVAARDAKMQASFGDPQAAPQVAVAEPVVEPAEPGAQPVGAATPAVNVKQLAPAAAAKPAKKDEWELYVEQFVARYDLTPEQQAKARTILSDLERQRENYMSGKASLLEKLGKQYNDAKGPEQFEAAEAQRQKLMQPVDRMFQTLKERLDKLPTRDQRRKAADTPTAEKSAAEKVPTKPASPSAESPKP